MSRPTRPIHRFAATLAAALALIPVSSAAALTTPPSFSSGVAVTAADASATVHGQFAASQISGAIESPDHLRIAFAVENPPVNAQSAATRAIWVVRADGTQLTKLQSSDSWQVSFLFASWTADSAALSYQYSYPYDHMTTHTEYRHVTVSGGTDTWSTGPGFDLWPHTDNEQWRIVTHASYSYTYVTADSIATGQSYTVLDAHGPGPYGGEWAYASGCDATGLAPTFSNIEAAVGGEFAPCLFVSGIFAPRSPGESNGGYSTVASGSLRGSEIYNLTDPTAPFYKDYPPYAISDAHYSTDKRHILFRVSTRSTPATEGGPTKLLSQFYVVARADGTQPHAFEVTDATKNAFANGGAWTANGNGLTYQVLTYVYPQSVRTVYAKLTVSGDTDTWSLVPRDDVGYTTSDGRFRVVAPLDSAIPTTYRVVDLATGIGYDVLSVSPDGTLAWIAPGCGSTGLDASADTIPRALAGPNPACTFAKPKAPATTPAPAATTPVATTPSATSPQSETVPTTPQPSVPTTPKVSAPATTPKPTTPAAMGPALKFLAATTSLSAVRRSGIVVKYSAVGATRLRVWLLPKSGAGEALARVTITKVVSGNGAVRIRLSKSGLKALAGLKSAPLVVRLAATDAAGHATVVDTHVKLG